MLEFVKLGMLTVLEKMIQENWPLLEKYLDDLGLDKGDLLVFLMEQGDPNPSIIKFLDE